MVKPTPTPSLIVAQVNEALRQEIIERAALERQLAATQAALAEAEDRPHGLSKEKMQAPSAIQ